jgi:hypothetical protein
MDNKKTKVYLCDDHLNCGHMDEKIIKVDHKDCDQCDQEELIELMDNKKHHHKMATDWNYAIKEHIKTGLESPIPYKVIPYKNGIGIKKIEFFKPIKNGSL